MHFEDAGAMGGGSTEFEHVQTESLDLYATGRPFKTQPHGPGSSQQSEDKYLENMMNEINREDLS